MGNKARQGRPTHSTRSGDSRVYTLHTYFIHSTSDGVLPYGPGILTLGMHYTLAIYIHCLVYKLHTHTLGPHVILYTEHSISTPHVPICWGS